MSDTTIAQEAQEILDAAGDPDELPGLDADTKVTLLNTTVATSRDLELGERVEFRVVGYVNFEGNQLMENEGKRHIVKVHTTLIEFIDD